MCSGRIRRGGKTKWSGSLFKGRDVWWTEIFIVIQPVNPSFYLPRSLYKSIQIIFLTVLLLFRRYGMAVETEEVNWQMACHVPAISAMSLSREGSFSRLRDGQPWKPVPKKYMGMSKYFYDQRHNNTNFRHALDHWKKCIKILQSRAKNKIQEYLVGNHCIWGVSLM